MQLANTTDLIVAAATPPGQGGVGIVRLSGPGAMQVAEQLRSTDGKTQKPLRPRHATFARLYQAGEVIDEGLIIWYPAPHSFTGEDVVELQVHGSPVVLQILVGLACKLGARVARPGEFSERAFHNEKLDLTQAEAIADLIAAGSAQAARAAVRSLQGDFASTIYELAAALEKVRMLVEASIDFPEEDQDFLAGYQVPEQLAAQQQRIAEILIHAERGQRLQEGVAVAILGPPNAGKSSLLNALTGEDAAIVADIPGTTRDLLKVDFVADGVPVRLVDTAGLRSTADEIELQGIQRARVQADAADILLVVLDASVEDYAGQLDQVLKLAELSASDPRLGLVINKSDLQPNLRITDGAIDQVPVIGQVSAKTHANLDQVRAHLAGGQHAADTPFLARARHVSCLEQAAAAIANAQAMAQQKRELELIAEELRSAGEQLGEIVGHTSADDLLGKIFSEFCIGK